MWTTLHTITMIVQGHTSANRSNFTLQSPGAGASHEMLKWEPSTSYVSPSVVHLSCQHQTTSGGNRWCRRLVSVLHFDAYVRAMKQHTLDPAEQFNKTQWDREALHPTKVTQKQPQQQYQRCPEQKRVLLNELFGLLCHGEQRHSIPCCFHQ